MEWKNKDKVPYINETTARWIFIPDDELYDKVEGVVDITVNKIVNAPGMPDPNIEVTYNIKKVGQVPLSDNWEWNVSDKDKELEVGTALSAIAEYKGENASFETQIKTIADIPMLIKQEPSITPGNVASSSKEIGEVVADQTTGAYYIITSTDGKVASVSYRTPTNKKLTVVNIPSKVAIDGTEYNVTEIEDNAFKGINSKAKVKVPKNKLKEYRLILKKVGVNGKKQKIYK